MIVSDFISALWQEIQRHVAEFCALVGILIPWVVHQQKKPRLKASLHLDLDSCGIPSMVHVSITNHGGSSTTINRIEGVDPQAKKHQFGCTYVPEKNKLGARCDGPKEIQAKQTLIAFLADGHIIAEGKISKLYITDGCLKKLRVPVQTIQKQYHRYKTTKATAD